MFSQENAFENVVWKMAAIFLGLYVLNDRLTRVLECTEELANPFDALFTSRVHCYGKM